MYIIISEIEWHSRCNGLCISSFHPWADWPCVHNNIYCVAEWTCKYVYVYMSIYMYIIIYSSFHPWAGMYMCIWWDILCIRVNMYIYVCIYVYIYIYNNIQLILSMSSMKHVYIIIYIVYQSEHVYICMYICPYIYI